MKMLPRLFACGAISFYLLAPGAIIFAAAPVPTCQLKLNTSSIQVGGSVTLKWTSTNATAGAITSVGNVGPSGQINLLPPAASRTTYVGSFTGPGGTANCSATVAVTYGTGTTDTTVTPAPTPAATTITPNTTQGLLVPCGYGTFSSSNSANGNASGSATGCQACDLATLVQNLINFAIGLSIPIAAALFAWAGILFFTAVDDHHKIDQAKGIFRSAFIGFVIAITAWLVINTLLHVLFSQGEFANGNWFTIQCSSGAARPNDNSIGGVLGTVLGSGSITTNGTPSLSGGGGSATSGGASNSGYGCAAGYQLDNGSGFTDDSGNDATSISCVQVDKSGNVTAEAPPTCAQGYSIANGISDPNATGYTGQCINDSSGTVADVPNTTVILPGSGGGVANPQLASQLAASCSQYGITDCSVAQGIAKAESSGGTNCITSPTGAVGCMQVLPTTACTLNPTITGCDTCRSSLSAGCASVAQIISDPAVNTNLGVKYIAQLQNQFGSCQSTASAYFQGPGATSNSLRNTGNIPPVAVSYAAKVCGN